MLSCSSLSTVHLSGCSYAATMFYWSRKLEEGRRGVLSTKYQSMRLLRFGWKPSRSSQWRLEVMSMTTISMWLWRSWKERRERERERERERKIGAHYHLLTLTLSSTVAAANYCPSRCAMKQEDASQAVEWCRQADSTIYASCFSYWWRLAGFLYWWGCSDDDAHHYCFSWQVRKEVSKAVNWSRHDDASSLRGDDANGGILEKRKLLYVRIVLPISVYNWIRWVKACGESGYSGNR